MSVSNLSISSSARFKLWGGLALLSVFACASASADPLSLTELNRFNTWVQCIERCETVYHYAHPDQPTFEEQRARFSCIAKGAEGKAACGVPSRLWEKDGTQYGGPFQTYPIDRHDLKLAIIEYQSTDNPKDTDLDSARQNLTDEERNTYTDYAQMMCYGGTTERSTDPNLEYSQDESRIVIPGTLCAYDKDAPNPYYGCPYFSLIGDAENDMVSTGHIEFCGPALCALPEYTFEADLRDFDAQNGASQDQVYWAGSHRPFLCPEVVCDLYNPGDSTEPVGDLSDNSSFSPTADELVELCSPSDNPEREGVPNWLDQHLGDQVLCDLAQEGGSGCALNERCAYQDSIGRGVCRPRAECSGSRPCTVAHLEKKSETDQEVIVWIYFDHSDAPVRVLDFHLNYPNNQMVLADARRLPALEYLGGPNGKTLTTTHLSDQTLRVSIFDAASSAPIPYGPLVELVFQRSGLYGLCYDQNQNGERDLMYDENRPCHASFLACDGILETGQTPRFNRFHATRYERAEHQTCFAQLEACLGVSDASRASAIRLINPELTAEIDENGDGEINAADDRYDEDRNFDGWVDARDCLDFEISFTDRDDLQELSMAPSSDQIQEDLREDSVWGEGVQLNSRQDAKVKLRLWYSFDSLSSSLKFKNIHSAEELCALTSECANEPEEEVKARLIRQLKRLQEGKVVTTEELEGVITQGAFFNGSNDHLQLPVTFNEQLSLEHQDFSVSMWYYSEGNERDEDPPQILFAHTNAVERTRFGVWLRQNPNQSEEMYLEFFDGDYFARDLSSGLVAQRIATLPIRKWQHFTFTIDVSSKQMTFYHNGERSEVSYTFPSQETSPFSCPQFNRQTDILLNREGDFLGGQPSEVVYYSAKESGLYKIKSQDLSGGLPEVVIGNGEFSYIQPDYSPVLDKIAYSTNQSGDYEIWIADGNGENPQQVTIGFGDSSRGLRALSPRWAPDGSGLIFESNMYDVLGGDNIIDRVYHLYYVEYDARNNEVAVPLQSGSTTTQLDYLARLSEQSLVFYRLTDLDQTSHHRKARWMRGTQESGDQVERGWVIYEKSDPLFSNKTLVQLRIDDQIPLSSTTTMTHLKRGEIAEELSLLDAFYAVKATASGLQEIQKVFFKREFARYYTLDQALDETATTLEYPDGHDEFITTSTSTASEIRYTLKYQPTLQDGCWDINQNGLNENIEDLDKNADWDKRDCARYFLNNFFFQYNEQAVSFKEVNPLDLTASPYAKEVIATPRNAPGRSMVSLSINSPYGTYPLIHKNETAPSVANPFSLIEVVFTKKPSYTDGAEQIKMIRRLPLEELAIHTLSPSDFCWDLNVNRIGDVGEDRNGDGVFDTLDCEDFIFESSDFFETVNQAQFSPSGEALLFDAISQAKPILIYTDQFDRPDTGTRLGQKSQSLKGLSWRRREGFAACNWVGGYMQPYARRLVASLRGGMDEFKLHEGLREITSIRSEFERGHEWLVKEGRDESIDTNVPQCGQNHLECPPFHLCLNSECVVSECLPESQTAGQTIDATRYTDCMDYGAHCVLKPASVELSSSDAIDSDFSWVCAADCNFDRECYTQSCMNGPCLFCDQDRSSCSECRETEVNLSNLIVRRTEGCPDERAFYCEAGACQTECYSFENDQSLYLCDPVTEYCERGRCVLNEWGWRDFSPMTMMGASDARFEIDDPDHLYTMAIGESYPLTIEAYGVSDYGNPPEVLVEVKGGPYYTDWQSLGRVTILNQTQTDAARFPIHLDSVYPYTSVRLRLIQAPYQNVMSGATGLGVKDRDFCEDDIANSGIAPELCQRRAQGSRYNIGYRVGIPEWEMIQSCRDKGHGGCPGRGRSENDFLYGGAPGVMVTELKSNGGSIMNALSYSQVCSYQGGLSPIEGDGADGATRAKKLYYGALFNESSNQKEFFCERNPETCFAETSVGAATTQYQGAVALLNCNYYDPAEPFDSAYLEFSGISYLPPPQERGAIVFDNGDQCLVELDALRNTTCYEWLGSNVAFDPFITTHAIDQPTPYEVSRLRSFGHDQGFTPVPPPKVKLQLNVTYTPSTMAAGDFFTTTFPEVNELINGESKSIDDTSTPFLRPRGYPYHLNFNMPENSIDRCYFIDRGSEASQLIGFADPISTNRLNNGEGDYTDPINIDVKCEKRREVGGCVLDDNQQSCIPSTGRLTSGKFVRLSLSVTANGGEVSQTISDVRVPLGEDFKFNAKVTQDTQYTASIISSPPGKVCSFTSGRTGAISATSLTAVQLTCSDQPSYRIPFRVVQLNDAGVAIPYDPVAFSNTSIILAESFSQSSHQIRFSELDATGGGLYPQNLSEPDQYTLSVQESPDRFTCTLATASGGFESDPVEIRCTPASSFNTYVNMIGLADGDQISLRLSVVEPVYVERFNQNDEVETHLEWHPIAHRSQQVDHTYNQTLDPLDPNAAGQIQFSSVSIYNNERVRVELLSHSDTTRCVISVADSPGAPTAPAADNKVDFQFLEAYQSISPVIVQCANLENEEVLNPFKLSGTISGLTQSGLRLIANEAFTEHIVGADETTFEFDAPFAHDAYYDVRVAQNPENQLCEVINGAGRFRSPLYGGSGDVTDVEVRCIDAASIMVHLPNDPSMANAKIQALLFSKRSGTQFSIKLGDDGGDLSVASSGATSFPIMASSGGGVLSLADGDYHLYVFIDSNLSTTETGSIHLTKADKGYYQELSVQGGGVKNVNIPSNGLKQLIEIDARVAVHPGFARFLILLDDDDDENDEGGRNVLELAYYCQITPPGILSDDRRTIPYPVSGHHSVVSEAAHVCNGDACLNTRTSNNLFVKSTNRAVYIPDTPFGISCVYDIEDTGAFGPGDQFIIDSNHSGITPDGDRIHDLHLTMQNY